MPHFRPLSLLLFSAALAPCVFPQGPACAPAHHGHCAFALKTNDLAAARRFYGHDLGFAELFSIDNPSGGLLLTLFKVNDRQYIEVRPELRNENGRPSLAYRVRTNQCTPAARYLSSRIDVPESLSPCAMGILASR